MNLYIDSDQDMSAAVAEHVAGLKRAGYNGGSLMVEDSRGVVFQCPPYATSADAVLPLLAGWRWEADWHPQHGAVRVVLKPTISHPAGASSVTAEAFQFAWAACNALLQGNGHEVTFV